MNHDADPMNELHWLIDMVQTIEVGLVVLDRQFNIQLWNGFMENHSGISPNELKGNNLFQRFPELPADWLKQKMEQVFLLKNNVFISWEQRPYIFKFNNYRPITGRAEFMYQNITLLPLSSLTGTSHISMIIYDVTDIAINKLQLTAANEQLQQLTQRDELTQLFNRRHWQQLVEQEFARFSRYQEPTTLMMVDIDYLKQINDQHGHIAGDRAIQHLAHLVSRNLRNTDVACRYGANSFALLLHHCDTVQASQLAARLQFSLQQTPLLFNGSHLSFAISIGISTLNDECSGYDRWLDTADEALANAKMAGRDQINIVE
ncbi:GGDEF domain-containing protein [Shewanella yunxiaonensis]|uniref:diguanylate cyclase n=1 Tax=Shewanella yunxiaonensis TaxID=2829809 RepID=A0ABX7YUM8_9GAMM|nr:MULTISPECIES: sensor domain-containing diguanylate cyclase [Shewanella]MDF0533048.1 sensor domain-containing diguanylate cyclase [Shewanella sp. A32]QUN06340.1 GGDEF domain-containing protein [Shewanella yunxiaonensis]